MIPNGKVRCVIDAYYKANKDYGRVFQGILKEIEENIKNQAKCFILCYTDTHEKKKFKKLRLEFRMDVI